MPSLYIMVRFASYDWEAQYFIYIWLWYIIYLMHQINVRVLQSIYFCLLLDIVTLQQQN